MIDKEINEILNLIPDFSMWNEALEWMEKGRSEISKISHDWALEAEFVSLEWDQIKENQHTPFGLYSSFNWRRCVLATFFADLASYPIPVDQVTFDRLLYVMHQFPEGFRTWWVKLDSGSWWPVGYTGWYPMFETLYEIMKKHPEKLRNRICIPNALRLGSKKNLYLFNYSVIAPFKRTPLSRELIKTYVVDICGEHPDGMACITLSSDGIRIAERLGLSYSGEFILDGSIEKVYIS